MGFHTRYILDFTDHVWTEVYIESEKRWFHCDSCEGRGALDTPLMYEQGWGKKLSYVFAINEYTVKDVTLRYTKDFQQLTPRRTLCKEDWLARILVYKTAISRCLLPPAIMEEYSEMDTAEDVSFGVVLPDGEYAGRQSGSIYWREMRGEMGKDK